MKISIPTLKVLTKHWLMVMTMLSLLLLTNCAWKEVVVIPDGRQVVCPEDKTKPCQVSRAFLLERYETERGLLKQLEECKER